MVPRTFLITNVTFLVSFVCYEQLLHEALCKDTVWGNSFIGVHECVYYNSVPCFLYRLSWVKFRFLHQAAGHFTPRTKPQYSFDRQCMGQGPICCYRKAAFRRIFKGDKSIKWVIETMKLGKGRWYASNFSLLNFDSHFALVVCDISTEILFHWLKTAVRMGERTVSQCCVRTPVYKTFLHFNMSVSKSCNSVNETPCN